MIFGTSEKQCTFFSQIKLCDLFNRCHPERFRNEFHNY